MIYLEAFTDKSEGFGKYALEQMTGKYSLKDYPDQDYDEASKDCLGWGDVCEVNLKGRRDNIFVGFYLHGTSMRLYVDGKTFDWPGGYTAIRKVAPLGELIASRSLTLKTFQVEKGGQVQFECTYSFNDSDLDSPGPAHRDIFYFVASTVGDDEELNKQLGIWENKATSKGME